MAELWHLTAYFTCLLLIDTASASTNSSLIGEQLAEGYLNASNRNDDYSGRTSSFQRNLKCGEHIFRIGTRSSKAENRIYNGKIVYPGQFPYSVRLHLKGDNGRRGFCGGSIISHRWILTAAHCIKMIINDTLTIRFQVTGAIVGDYSRQQTFDGGKNVHIVRTILHPEYKPIKNDIALLQMAEYVEFDLKEQVGGYGAINRVCLTSTDIKNQLDNREIWLVAGWGRKEDGEIPDSMFYYKPKLVDYSLCKTTDFKNKQIVFDPESMICNFNEGRQSTAHGDSGSGVVRILPDGRYELLGVVSFGHPIRLDTEPSVRMNVYHYLDWIKSYVRDLDYP